MKCPKCGKSATTLDTRERDATDNYPFNYLYRKHRCKSCRHLFYTLEMTEDDVAKYMNDKIVKTMVERVAKKTINARPGVLKMPQKKAVNKKSGLDVMPFSELRCNPKEIPKIMEYVTNHTLSNSVEHYNTTFNAMHKFCEESGCRPMPKRIYSEYHLNPGEQICFFCKKCTNGNLCSWVRCGKPVPGWEATETKIKSSSPKCLVPYTKSYRITKCPKFEPDDIPTFEPGFDFKKFEEQLLMDIEE